MPTWRDWRDGLLFLAAFFLLQALCDPAPAAEINRGPIKERNMVAVIKQWEEINSEKADEVAKNIPDVLKARVEVLKRSYGAIVKAIEIDTPDGATLRITASSDNLYLAISRTNR